MGDYKRTAMETINQFVSRHDYQNFIKRLGGKAENQAQILTDGSAYSNWVKNLRDFLQAAKVDELKAVEHFRGKLLNEAYDTLDDELYEFIKNNSRTSRSKSEVLRILEESSIVKWEDFIKDDVL